MKHGLLVVAALAPTTGCDKAGSKTIVDDLAVGEVRLIGAGVGPRISLRP